MDPRQNPQPVGFDSSHYWATPDSRIDLSVVKPHTCMTDLVQRGNYIHCNVGHHGMRIAPNQILDNVDGEWVLRDMIVQNSPNLRATTKHATLNASKPTSGLKGRDQRSN